MKKLPMNIGRIPEFKQFYERNFFYRHHNLDSLQG